MISPIFHSHPTVLPESRISDYSYHHFSKDFLVFKKIQINQKRRKLCINQYCNLTPKFQYKKQLPEQKLQDRGKITLCLDLDHTLISTSTTQIENYDFSISLPIDQKRTQKLYIKKRPLLDLFLQKCSEMFEIVLFTASVKSYADKVLDILDPDNNLISHRLYRGSCSFYNGHYVKDLCLLNRDLHSILIIDDAKFSFVFQPENAIWINPFYNNLDTNQFVDNQLEDVLSILENVYIQHNVIDTLASYRNK
ncbi:nli interacting factor-like phosphatase family protein [Anaeramoeba flamelloides]|uniref:Nli interacting factor-like phosphatase family protein n=1 Tax=Anaeramoeba flamelloides TaxID=1746091 RepID=A0ABQ8XD45_9EUKA|nr:nli interacting factor-like phosphatase family protein [Anaeramoeba flamelloides]